MNINDSTVRLIPTWPCGEDRSLGQSQSELSSVIASYIRNVDSKQSADENNFLTKVCVLIKKM